MAKENRGVKSVELSMPVKQVKAGEWKTEKGSEKRPGGFGNEVVETRGKS
ncbi:hypothetical protein AAG747_08770 [Rapidithrix thailandica]|uniref:Uncharacterized protein n=1 Tax=Rapidithrix thailandica TaxID=413964 RepID=A0AAW9S8C5_9BACT